MKTDRFPKLKNTLFFMMMIAAMMSGYGSSEEKNPAGAVENLLQIPDIVFGDIPESIIKTVSGDSQMTDGGQYIIMD